MRDLIAKHAAPVPRYTSYPTAPHFSATVDGATYRNWLQTLPPRSNLSLYFHIPYCDKLCWYCGCHTKAVQRYEPVAKYLIHLRMEIETVAALLAGHGHRVGHLHFGGGSPDIMSPDDIASLTALIRSRFELAGDAEFAVEIDPRALDLDRVAAFAKAGVNRVSIGVQDFEPAVQRAINRLQSFAETQLAVEAFRAAGIGSVNLDLVYGLPHQSELSVIATLQQVLQLAPERVAIFGYAHLPQRIKHQRLIDEASLPDAFARFEQSRLMAEHLVQAGYQRIGLDHFARPDDRLAAHAAEGELKRNFQGYTTDAADALIGFGASAIGQLPQGYVQNIVPISDYGRLVAEGGLATARGYALNDDDRLRRFVIERLMCDMTLSAHDLRARFGDLAEPVVAEAARLVAEDVDGLIRGEADGFCVTERGRPFVRSFCARFDAHLGRSAATHASGV